MRLRQQLSKEIANIRLRFRHGISPNKATWSKCTSCETHVFHPLVLWLSIYSTYPEASHALAAASAASSTSPAMDACPSSFFAELLFSSSDAFFDASSLHFRNASTLVLSSASVGFLWWKEHFCKWNVDSVPLRLQHWYEKDLPFWKTPRTINRLNIFWRQHEVPLCCAPRDTVVLGTYRVGIEQWEEN